MALRAFDMTLGRSAEGVIDAIKKKQLNVYVVFEEFTTKLDKAGYSPHTIARALNLSKHLLHSLSSLIETR